MDIVAPGVDVSNIGGHCKKAKADAHFCDFRLEMHARTCTGNRLRISMLFVLAEKIQRRVLRLERLRRQLRFRTPGESLILSMRNLSLRNGLEADLRALEVFSALGGVGEDKATRVAMSDMVETQRQELHGYLKVGQCESKRCSVRIDKVILVDVRQNSG